jgi:hypothetical protein
MPDHKPTKEELDAHSVKEALDVQPKVSAIFSCH